MFGRWNPFGGDRWNWGNFFGTLALFATYMAASIAG